MLRDRSYLWAFPLLAPLLLTVEPSLAQTFRGTISGNIVDPSGSVSASSTAALTSTSTTTSAPAALSTSAAAAS